MIVPDLFNSIIMHLMACVCQQISRVQLDSYDLMYLEYVNDTTLFSNKTTELKAGFNFFKEEPSVLSLEVSWENSKVMHIRDGPDPPPITISSTVVEFVISFKFLGSIMMNTGDLSDEINN